MHLTGHHFLQIIEALRSDPLYGKRASPRVGLRFKAIAVPCVDTDNVPEHEVWVRDLSETGVGFVHSAPFELDSFVILQFIAGENRLAVLYRIMRCKQVGPRSYDIGGRLDRILSTADLTDD